MPEYQRNTVDGAEFLMEKDDSGVVRKSGVGNVNLASSSDEGEEGLPDDGESSTDDEDEDDDEESEDTEGEVRC